MPGRLRADKPLNANDTFTAISAIFDQVQNTSANHQKNIVALHKIFVDLAQLRGRTQNGDTILIGERRFEQVIYDILLRLLESRKGAFGDRVVKFFGGFVDDINAKAGKDPIDKDDIDEYGVAYTPAARFTERLLEKLLLKGLGAKEKIVRYRIVQLCAELVFNLGEIETRIYYDLRGGLLDRIHDKEHSIRSQAAIALCKFHENDDPVELKEYKLEPLSEVLYESLAYDPQPEVRRAILVNLPVNKTTIPLILDRARDVDVVTRKLVYTILDKNVTTGADEENLSIGFAHPRALTIEQRKLIVRNGLGDRNENVRAAAAKLIERWIETADVSDHAQGDGNTPADEAGLVGLLKMFDLRADKIVADAIIRIFESNPHLMDRITFSDAYWFSLTPETAFLARTCVKFCESRKDDARLEEILPVVTSFAFRLQEHFNILVDNIRSHDRVTFEFDDEARVLRQDSLKSQEFVVMEMLEIAISLDYGDEIGRRKMNSLIRDMLIHDYLPDDLVAPCMEVLSRLADSERDLIRVVAIEIVQALRDPGDNEDEDADQDIDPDASFDSLAPTPPPARPKKSAPQSRQEMSEPERARTDKIDQRCLCICESMLERVNGTLENNSSLDGIVKELIYPAVQRKDDRSREQGFRCLALISLISKNIAQMALAFFIKQMKIEQNPEELSIIIMQAVFDTLMKYGEEIMAGVHSSDALLGHFTELLEHKEYSEDFRAVLCVGLAKLALPGVLVDEKIMKFLLIDYFLPKNVNNQKLKQCLSFFFQAYCASSIQNQEIISSLFVPVYCDLCETNLKMDDDEEMASMAQIAGMFLDWTHPNKLYVKDKEQGEFAHESHCLHFNIARDIIKEFIDRDSRLTKEHKKVLCQHLTLLHLPDDIDEDNVRFMNLLLDKVPSCRPLPDTVSKNAFAKFQSLFVKKYEKQLEGLSAEEYLSHEKHQAEAEFLNDIIPLEDLAPSMKRGRKRRSGSVTSSAAEDDTSTSKKDVRTRRRARLSTSDDSDSDDNASDDDDEETEQGSPPVSSRRSSVAPTRTMPKRQATRKPPVEVITISSDSEEEPTPRNVRPRPTLDVRRQSEDLSQVTVGHSEGDSEEEDEVSGLLADI